MRSMGAAFCGSCAKCGLSAEDKANPASHTAKRKSRTQITCQKSGYRVLYLCLTASKENYQVFDDPVKFLAAPLGDIVT